MLSSKYPQRADYETPLGELAEVFLERVDPKRRQERRKRRETRNNPRAEVASAGSGHLRAKAVPKTSVPESRHIPAREKEKVWGRDSGRCSYVGSGCRRCNSTHNLQFDHYPVPFARGEPSNAGSLRLLCAKHNRFTGEKIFGRRDLDKYRVSASGRKHRERLNPQRE